MSLNRNGLDSEPTTPTTPTESSKGNITNKILLEAIANEAAFDKLYLDITNRAIDLYIKGGRRKFALKLHGFLAALHLLLLIFILSVVSFILKLFAGNGRGSKKPVSYTRLCLLTIFLIPGQR